MGEVKFISDENDRTESREALFDFSLCSAQTCILRVKQRYPKNHSYTSSVGVYIEHSCTFKSRHNPLNILNFLH